MHAHARIEVARDERSGCTRIIRLRSDPPLVLRPTHVEGPRLPEGWNLSGPTTARVSLVAGAAGPLGGDHLQLDLVVGPGATLVVRGVAASLLLPGAHGEPSSNETTLRVAEGGTLVWLPQQLIAAHGCDHTASTRVTLEAGARLLAREEALFGRHGEEPGRLRQHLRVTLAGQPLLDQELSVGPRAPGWDGPAVTGGHHAQGSLLAVDPARQSCEAMDAPASCPDVAVLRLAGPAVLVTALAPDAHTLRRHLDFAL